MQFEYKNTATTTTRNLDLIPERGLAVVVNSSVWTPGDLLVRNDEEVLNLRTRGFNMVSSQTSEVRILSTEEQRQIKAHSPRIVSEMANGQVGRCKGSMDYAENSLFFVFGEEYLHLGTKCGRIAESEVRAKHLRDCTEVDVLAPGTTITITI